MTRRRASGSSMWRNPARERGRDVVHVLFEAEYFNIDPARVREKLTPKTKAIICVHYGGNPCDMNELWAIGREHGVPVIEDCAHALGPAYKGHSSVPEGTSPAFRFRW